MPVYQNKKRCLAVFGVFSAVVMVMIFYFSSQPAEESLDTSNGLLGFLLSVLGPLMRTEEQRAALTGMLQASIRKAAHFTEYTVLGFFLTLFFAGTNKTLPRAVFPALLVGIPYAGTDEWHQTFVDGRSGELRDILIDAAGIACAVEPVA